jgi:hypothetical protein
VAQLPQSLLDAVPAASTEPALERAS